MSIKKIKVTNLSAVSFHDNTLMVFHKDDQGNRQSVYLQFDDDAAQLAFKRDVVNSLTINDTYDDDIVGVANTIAKTIK